MDGMNRYRVDEPPRGKVPGLLTSIRFPITPAIIIINLLIKGGFIVLSLSAKMPF